MSAQDNLIVYAGQGFDATTLQYQWTLDDLPVDLTGYAARAMIRSTFDAPDPLATWTTANGKLLLGGPAGTITIVVPDTETSALWVPGLALRTRVEGRAAYMLGYWDLELVPPSAAVQRFLQGEAWIVPEATK